MGFENMGAGATLEISREKKETTPEENFSSLIIDSLIKKGADKKLVKEVRMGEMEGGAKIDVQTILNLGDHYLKAWEKDLGKKRAEFRVKKYLEGRAAEIAEQLITKQPKLNSDPEPEEPIRKVVNF